mgnify:CR=1 FL=1
MASDTKVITVFSQIENVTNPSEIEYPKLQALLDNGYYIKETFFASNASAEIVTLTFILKKP